MAAVRTADNFQRIRSAPAAQQEQMPASSD